MALSFFTFAKQLLDLKLLKAPLMRLRENHAFSKYDFALNLNKYFRTENFLFRDSRDDRDDVFATAAEVVTAVTVVTLADSLR